MRSREKTPTTSALAERLTLEGPVMGP